MNIEAHLEVIDDCLNLANKDILGLRERIAALEESIIRKKMEYILEGNDLIAALEERIAALETSMTELEQTLNSEYLAFEPRIVDLEKHSTAMVDYVKESILTCLTALEVRTTNPDQHTAKEPKYMTYKDSDKLSVPIERKPE